MKHFKLIFVLVIAWMMGTNVHAASVGTVFTTKISGVNMKFKILEMNGSSYWFVSTYGDVEDPAIPIGTEGLVNIPETFNYNGVLCTVTEIGNSSFTGCSKVTSFIIPSSVYKIGKYAFEGCSSITKITIPWVSDIGKAAFASCTSLEKLVLLGLEDGSTPQEATYMTDGVFANCPLKEIICYCPLPATINFPLEVDRAPCFSGYNTNCVVKVPYGCAETYINSAWNSYFEEHIVEMDATNGEVFTANTVEGISMKFKVTGDNTVMTYGDTDEWEPCVQLSESQTSVTIPSSVTYKGHDYTVTEIGDVSFSGCELESVTIPSTVTTIGNLAFSYSSLTSINISASVTSIGEEAFSVCPGLTSITVDTSNSYYDSREQCNAIIETSANTMIAGCQNSSIPVGVTKIASAVFSYCDGLTTITIPESVTSIGTDAFYACQNLSLVVSKAITPPTLQEDAFAYIASNAVLNVYSSVLNDYVNSAWSTYFQANNIVGVAGGPLQVGDTFTANTNEGVEMVFMVTGKNTVMTYADTDEWTPCVELSEDQTTITIPETVTCGEYSYTVTEIGVFSFGECVNLQSVTIPSSVTSIGEYAFCDCYYLNSVNIPEGVVSLEYGTFAGCYSLTSISIPSSTTTIHPGAFQYAGLTTITVDSKNPIYDSRNQCNAIIETQSNTLYIGCQNSTIPYGVTTIGEGAFSDCWGLTSITFPETVTTIGEGAFYGCESLTSISIPKSVTSIDFEAFMKCSALTSITVDANNPKYDSRDQCNAIIETLAETLITGCKNTTIPDGVTTIGYSAFASCFDLNSIDIPSSVTTIKNSAFYNCTNLTSITISNSVTSIGDYAFSGCGKLSLVVSKATTPPTLGNNAFYNISSDAVLNVLSSAKTEYESSDWNQYFSVINSLNDITIGETGIATLSSASALDFTQVEGLKAYIVSVFDPASRELTLTHLDKAPASTGLLLKGAAGTYQVPAVNYVAGVANMLVPILENNYTLQPTENVNGVNYTNFVLTKYEGEVGFFRFREAQTYPAGKAYLRMETSLVDAANNGQGEGVAGFKLVFDDDEATGIVEMSVIKPGDTTIYNLSGQRVSQTKKGVYIVNGKKVLVK